MENKETTYNLPDSWIWTTLGEIGIVTSGGTPSSRQPDFWGGDIAWITPADLSNYKNKYIEQGQRSITKVGLDNSSAKLLPKGTVLFSSRAPIGYTVIAKNEIATNQGFKNLILTKSGYPDYIYYFLQASKQLAESYASGTTFLELSATKFSQIPFPLPPLAEQYRIVDKIEELFSELDKAQENLLNAKKQIEIFRQVVLKDAFDGKLTEKWRTENEFIKEETWSLKKIEDIGVIYNGGTPSTKENSYWGGDVPWITPADLSNFKKKYIDKGKRNITKLGLNNSSTKLLPTNTILFSTRAPIGYVAIANNNLATNQGFKSIVVDTFIFHEFVYYYLIANKQLAINLASGTTFLELSTKKFREIPIVIPIYQEQKQIVEEIEYRFTLIDNLENSVIDNLKRIEIYRQIILQKAFTGKLVKQDKSDKSVNELLQRIETEKTVYERLQKEIAKNKPKKIVFMESKKTIKEILEEATEPMEAKDIWQKSIHKDDIERFYEELKQLSANIEEIREGKISKLLLKK